jgi:hypothetical protein
VARGWWLVNNHGACDWDASPALSFVHQSPITSHPLSPQLDIPTPAPRDRTGASQERSVPTHLVYNALAERATPPRSAPPVPYSWSGSRPLHVQWAVMGSVSEEICSSSSEDPCSAALWPSQR